MFFSYLDNASKLWSMSLSGRLGRFVRTIIHYQNINLHSVCESSHSRSEGTSMQRTPFEKCKVIMQCLKLQKVFDGNDEVWTVEI